MPYTVCHSANTYINERRFYYEKEIFEQSNGSRFKCRFIPYRLFTCYGSFGGGQVTETQNLGVNESTGVSEVVYDTAGDQHFTVIIPKKIVLGGDKQAEYGVTVKGDVAQGSRVKVEPQDDVEDVEGVNFVMEATGVGGSKNVDVTQDDLYWNYAEIVANDYEGTEKPGNVNGSELTFGMWQGNLTFLINFEDEYGDVGETEDYSGIEDWEYELNESAKTVTLKKYIGESLDVAVHSKYDIDGTVYEAQFNDVIKSPLFGNNRTKIQNITFDKNFDTSNVTDMSYMFSACNSLQSLDLSMFDTSNVTNMQMTFGGCKSLQSLDLKSFDTSNVTDMANMFYGCESLQSLDVSKFDTSNVIAMNDMFTMCYLLESLDLSSFNISNVTDMSSMFSCCYSLQSLDLNSFDTSNVIYMGSMFNSCYSLQSLDLKSFDTSNVTDMTYMFQECTKLQSIKVSSKWVTEQADTTDMFLDCGTDHVTYVD